MERNMTLIKQLLKYCEANAPGPRGFLFHPEIESFSTEQVEYHVRLCRDAGYARVNNAGYMVELTWEGHEVLEQLRGR